MLEKIRQACETELRQTMPAFTVATRFDALPGWDSVAHLSLLLTLERTLGLHFTAEEMASLQTVGDLLKIAEALHA